MPRQPHSPGPAHYAVLGLVAQAPRHGYELTAHLGPRGELGLIYTLGPSNLYAVLHALEGLGYVHAKISRVSSGPPRKIFRLTRAGKNAFRRWLDQPVRRIRQVRQDFLLKLFFSQHLPGHDTRALLDRQIAACRAYLRELEQADARAPLDGFRSLVLSSRRKAAEATIAWLVEQRRTLHPGTLLAARA